MPGLHDLTLEQEVLSCPLVDQSTWEILSDLVGMEDFSRPESRQVYMAMASLYKAGLAIDPVTLHAELRHSPVAQSHAMKLLDRRGTTSNLEAYCHQLRTCTTRRSIHMLGSRLQTQAADDSVTMDDLLATAQTGLDVTTPGDPNPEGIGQALGRWHDWVDADPEQRARNLVSTGLASLDQYLGGGIPRGSLVVVLGVPSMGKTALAVNNLAVSAAVAGHRSLVFTMETSARNMAGRAVATLSGVPLHIQLQGIANLTPRDKRAYSNALGDLQELPLSFVERRLALSQVCRIARLHKKRHGLSLFVVDFLQLVRADRDLKTQERELSEAIYAFQDLSVELDTVGVVVIQPDKSSRQRKSRLDLLDARGSSAIEDAAYLALLPFRPHVYDASVDKTIAEIGIGKWKDGPRGKIQGIKWAGHRMRFETLGGGASAVGR